MRHTNVAVVKTVTRHPQPPAVSERFSRHSKDSTTHRSFWTSTCQTTLKTRAPRSGLLQIPFKQYRAFRERARNLSSLALPAVSLEHLLNAVQMCHPKHGHGRLAPSELHQVLRHNLWNVAGKIFTQARHGRLGGRSQADHNQNGCDAPLLLTQPPSYHRDKSRGKEAFHVMVSAFVLIFEKCSRSSIPCGLP